jgi:hypothetical protein
MSASAPLGLAVGMRCRFAHFRDGDGDKWGESLDGSLCTVDQLDDNPGFPLALATFAADGKAWWVPQDSLTPLAAPAETTPNETETKNV